MQRIAREHARKYAFDSEDTPLLRVKCGERCEVETYDASTGYFKTENDIQCGSSGSALAIRAIRSRRVLLPFVNISTFEAVRLPIAMI